MAEDGLIEIRGNIIFVKDRDGLRALAERAPEGLRAKASRAVGALKLAESEEDVEDAVNMLIGIYDEFGNSLLFGVNLNDYIESWRELMDGACRLNRRSAELPRR